MASRNVWRLDRHRPLLGVLLVVLGVVLASPAATAQSDGADDEARAAASFLAELLAPDETFAPVEIELSGTLPRTGTFQGVELTVDRVHLTNTHPYTLFGEPTPGELFYVVVELTASNPTDTVHEYGFGDETFDLRTWSGRLLAHVPAPGTYDFGRLEPGDVKTDELVFGTEEPDVLDGSALLVGRPPDTALIVPLTAPPLAADYPMPVEPAVEGPYQAGAVAKSVDAGEAGLDRPAGVCCPDTGSRADDGELFLTLQLSGRVNGSKYGQATVSSDAVRLVVGGEPLEPFGFDGQANVPEGQAYSFPATWLAREDDAGLTLQFLDGADVVERVPLLIGETAFAADLAVPTATSPAAATVAGSSAEPPSPSPAVTAGPSPAPSAAPVPTPRPVTAAIATLLIYSGRPDPDWSLAQEDLDELAAVAAGLPAVEGSPPEGGLGYRGFRITGPQGTWRISEGVVQTPETARGTSLADPDRLVERYLLASGLETLTEDEAAIVAEALGPAPSPTIS